MQSELTAMALHGREVAGQRHLSLAEEIELGKRIENGDNEALELLVLANLWLVESVARKYCPFSDTSKMELTDLMQEGYLGLLDAARKYDWRRGYAFATYAFYPVRRAVSRGRIAMAYTVRLPVRADEVRRKIYRLREKHGGELSLNVEAIAQTIGSSANQVQSVLYHEQFVEPLPIENGLDDRPDEVVAECSPSPEQLALQADIERCLRLAIGDLPPLERRVLTLRFGLNGSESHPVAEVGRLVGLSAHEATATCRRALRTLRRRYGQELRMLF